MKYLQWQVVAGGLLVLLSVILGVVHYELFHNAHDLFFYLLLDLVLIPIEVLVVTLILHELLKSRERRAIRKKLNMVIGAFYSEVGNKLLKQFAGCDQEASRLRECLRVDMKWTEKDFAMVREQAASHHYTVHCGSSELGAMKDLLVGRREFLLGLLENPNLLEHETFTDLLWAVFHLTEELENRESLTALPKSDNDHLNGDIKRAYRHLTVEWLVYMRHLKYNYPYLFSLAVRTNPFDNEAKITVY
jgi:hypothetical protein